MRHVEILEGTRGGEWLVSGRVWYPVRTGPELWVTRDWILLLHHQGVLDAVRGVTKFSTRNDISSPFQK